MTTEPTPTTNTTTLTEDPDALRDAVRERYARAAVAAREATAPAGCCGPTTPVSAPSSVSTAVPTPREGNGCGCGPSTPGPSTSGPSTSEVPDLIGRGLYSSDDSAALPEPALAASLGCGNPTALAELHEGEVVLDLGSGGGIDVLLSARRVGPTGHAYGLDMTPEMLELARANQAQAGVDNAEFLEGTIESIPLPDNAVDVIISNCVINLSGNKDAVFAEAFRVLRPGGRLAVSDIVLRRELPAEVQPLMAAWTGCVAGALTDREYTAKLEAAGFADVAVEATQVFSAEDLARMGGDIVASLPAGTDVAALLADMDGAGTSSFVRATKPAAG